MRNTKLYLFIVLFEPGSARLPAPGSRTAGSVAQARMRAHMIPGHRIAIETYEDQSDSQDLGAAVRRAETLRQFMLDNGVEEARLELRSASETGGPGERGRYARRGEVNLFPRVASLFPASGQPYLSLQEVSMLQTARHVALFDADKSMLSHERFANIDWKRLVGHTTFEVWAAAGAHHPLYFTPDQGCELADDFSGRPFRGSDRRDVNGPSSIRPVKVSRAHLYERIRQYDAPLS